MGISRVPCSRAGTNPKIHRSKVCLRLSHTYLDIEFWNAELLNAKLFEHQNNYTTPINGMAQNGDHEMTDAAAGADIDAPVKVEKQRLRLVWRMKFFGTDIFADNKCSCLALLRMRLRLHLRRKTTRLAMRCVTLS